MEFTRMMALPIALLTFLPFSTALKAENDQAFMVQQNKKSVVGVIVDMAGLPLIGVNVGVKGTSEGTITDLDGKFNLNVSPQSVLVITYNCIVSSRGYSHNTPGRI